jgi:hypothetical protein
LLREYRQDAQTFSIDYQRKTHARLSEAIEAEIKQELLREKGLVEDRQLPISGYNYAALRDRLKKKGTQVSATTIIKRAKVLECYKPHRKGKLQPRSTHRIGR